MALTINDPDLKRNLTLSYPEEAFDAMIAGYARAVGVREDGEEIKADQFPQAPLHSTYDPDRNTWKPTRAELVQAHILVEAAMKAAQGLSAQQSEEVQKQNVADAKNVLANGWATITPQA